MARPDAPQLSVEGTQRRLQALMHRGWAPEAIEKAIGLPTPVAARALENQARISPEAAASISAAYDLLWSARPPQMTDADRKLSAAAAEHALRAGWAPPLAWDDDQIAKPDAQPAEGLQPGKRTTRRAADIAEDAAWVREQGGYRLAGNNEVAMRLGIGRNRLEKALERARDYDKEAC